MPAEVASTIGAAPGEHVLTLLATAKRTPPRSALVLSGALADAARYGTVAIALLPLAQTLTGRPERVTQVLVRPAAGGRTGWSQASCGAWPAGAWTWSRSTDELRLLASAEKPTNQSTTLFAAIGAMVGFLLAAQRDAAHRPRAPALHRRHCACRASTPPRCC